LLTYLESNEFGVAATTSGIYVQPDRSPATSPFLYIEIPPPTISLLYPGRRFDEHFARGVRYLWLFDPGSRHVYVATPAVGLHEFKGSVLHTENPVLELPLAEVFA